VQAEAKIVLLGRYTADVTGGQLARAAALRQASRA